MTRLWQRNLHGTQVRGTALQVRPHHFEQNDKTKRYATEKSESFTH